MLCVSSVKCDVRFFDTVAKKCIQRFSIAYFPFAINVMHFHSSTIENSKNKLILGDFEGNVWVLEIPEHFRNYFNTDNSVAEVKFSEIVKNVENRLKIKCLQFRNIHADMIRQVGFIGSLNSFISAADYQILKNVDQTAAAVIIGKLGAHTQITSFMMRGVRILLNLNKL